MKLRKPTISPDVARVMIQKAERAKANTYPDQGGYAVAVLTESGNIHAGVSYKSETHTLTMHAEAVALAHAAVHGEKNIVAITGPNCHICKQLIWESALHSGIDVQVIIAAEEGVKFVPISSLMPYPWPNERREV